MAHDIISGDGNVEVNDNGGIDGKRSILSHSNYKKLTHKTLQVHIENGRGKT